MSKPLLFVLALPLVFCGAMPISGCVSVKAPDEFYVANQGAPKRVDSSRVPPTSTHEEARRLLTEAYERNQYLEMKVGKLEQENRKLEAERDDYEERFERLKDRYED